MLAIRILSLPCGEHSKPLGLHFTTRKFLGSHPLEHTPSHTAHCATSNYPAECSRLVIGYATHGRENQSERYRHLHPLEHQTRPILNLPFGKSPGRLFPAA